MADTAKFDKPPVQEVTAAVQFAPVLGFGSESLVQIIRELGDWKSADLGPAIPRMTEAPQSNVGTEVGGLFFGSPPPRLTLDSEDGRWGAQVQHDRLAIHERRLDDKPSYDNVKPKLEELIQQVNAATSCTFGGKENPADLVELIYANWMETEPGSTSAVPGLLRMIEPAAGEPPFDGVEGMRCDFAFKLLEAEEFAGRIKVTATDQPGPKGQKGVAFQVNCRRLVKEGDFLTALKHAHDNAVDCLVAITRDQVQTDWERTR